ADGQAAAVYGQTPPLVNACRPPGQWQAYDIVFHRPHFAADGSVRDSARVTVFHNGILVQENTAITGWTVHGSRAHYQPHPDKLPLVLQDHGNPVRYRDIWVRELGGSPRQDAPSCDRAFASVSLCCSHSAAPHRRSHPRSPASFPRSIPCTARCGRTTTSGCARRRTPRWSRISRRRTPTRPAP